MRFLIAIKDDSEASRNNLQIGVNIATVFGADISVVYIGHRPRGLIANEVAVAQRSLSEWNIFHPGIGVLKWAFDTLRNLGFIAADVGEFDPSNILEEKDRFRMILPHVSGDKIRLILREGQILQELKNETEFRHYDLAIMGDPSTRRRSHQIIQFLDTSILIVKNFRPSWNYPIMVCVDDSPATKQAVIFATEISRHYDSAIRLLTVSRRKGYFGKGYRNASRWAKKYMTFHKVKPQVSYIFGHPADVFVREAGQNYIIVMGKSTGNEIFRFIFGDKPIHTAQRAQCPVLIVKPDRRSRV